MSAIIHSGTLALLSPIHFLQQSRRLAGWLPRIQVSSCRLRPSKSCSLQKLTAASVVVAFLPVIRFSGTARRDAVFLNHDPFASCFLLESAQSFAAVFRTTYTTSPLPVQLIGPLCP